MDTSEVFFTFLNTGALLGWTLIFLLLLSQLSFIQSNLPSLIQQMTSPFFDTKKTSFDEDRMPIIDLLLFLEGICFIEVGRIAIGQLKGNLILGIVLHIIRMSCLLIVLPVGLSENSASGNTKLISTLVLYSWALTEVGRYPMYLFPKSSAARSVRVVLPIITFPIAAIAEAVGAYWHLKRLLQDANASYLQSGLLVMVIGINTLLGPSLAYPSLLKKGLPVLTGRKGSTSMKKKNN